MDNYEVKYNAALERAKKLQETCDSQVVVGWCEYIFPELKESEDDDNEMIRKALIEYFRSQELLYDKVIGSITTKEVLAWLEKQGEQKSNDVEPKFHMGNWVVSNKDGKVYIVGTTYCITGDNICLHGIDGNHKWVNGDDLDKEYRLWTIQYAEDGDVLLEEETGEPFIYNGNRAIYFSGYFLGAHCGISNGEFNPLGNNHHWGKNSCPATKEQRDLLFHKMAEEGYEWDIEKKELKKIKVKTLDADKVIAWLVANIIDFEKYVRLFKKDFRL